MREHSSVGVRAVGVGVSVIFPNLIFILVNWLTIAKRMVDRVQAARVGSIGSRSNSVLISVSHLVYLHALKLFSATVVDGRHSIIPVRCHISG